MNFLKSVLFEEEEDSDSESQDTNEASSSNANANTMGSSKFWDLSNIVDTLVNKSEEVYNEYKGDFEEFGLGLKQETETLVEKTSLNVKSLPVSLEASALVAQESLEKVGSTIEVFGSTFWKGTQEIISQVKEAVAMVENEANLNFNLNNSGTNNNNNRAYNYSSLSKSGKYSRYEALISSMQRDSSTYCDEPEDIDDYTKWKDAFKLEDREKDIEDTLKDNAFMQELHSRIVPMIVEHETFWSRYFYRLHKLHEAENARANLVKRATTEEDLSWDVDDDDSAKDDEAKDDKKSSPTTKAKDETVSAEKKEEFKNEENDEASKRESNKLEETLIESGSKLKSSDKVETIPQAKSDAEDKNEVEQAVRAVDVKVENEDKEIKDDWQLIDDDEKIKIKENGESNGIKFTENANVKISGNSNSSELITPKQTNAKEENENEKSISADIKNKESKNDAPERIDTQDKSDIPETTHDVNSFEKGTVENIKEEKKKDVPSKLTDQTPAGAKESTKNSTDGDDDDWGEWE